MQITPRDITVRNAFNCFYEIPRFQRPYSWTDENVEALWRDIIENKGDEYFLGSMIVYSENDMTLRIIDGQQRLTTLSLLLACIRDIAKEIGANNLATGTQTFLQKVDEDNRKRSTLARTEDSQTPYLQEVYICEIPRLEIKDDEKTDEMRTIDSAYNTLKKHISDALPEEYSSIKPTETYSTEELEKVERELAKIRSRVLDVHILLIELDREEDAYTIFETINTRGLDLSITDLYKNLLSKHLRNETENDNFNRDWTSLIGEIQEVNNVDIDTFLYHSWNSRHTFSTRPKLYTNARELVKDKEIAQQILDELKEDWKSYRKLINPSSIEDKSNVWIEIQQSLEALRIFRVQQNVPYLIALLEACEREIIRPGKLATTLSTIEKFHYCFTAITNSRSSGGISSMYCKHARELTSATTSNAAAKSIRELVQKLKDRLPKRELFVSKFIELEFSKNEQKKSQLIRYILRTLNDDVDAVKFGLDDIPSIEHFLPQAAASEEGIPIDMIGNIGNLFLLPKSLNEQLGNKSVEAKLKAIDNSSHSRPRTLLQIKEWGGSQIQDRARRLANASYDRVISM